LRAAFDFYFPDLLGPLVPPPSNYMPNEAIEATIKSAFLNNPRALHDLLHLYGAADENNFVSVMAFIGYETMELQQRAGGNPFMQYSLPQAIIKLKQGFGRLIRGKTDSGIVVLLDSRVTAKRYGKLFLDALPNCKRVVNGTRNVTQRHRDAEEDAEKDKS